MEWSKKIFASSGKIYSINLRSLFLFSMSVKIIFLVAATNWRIKSLIAISLESEKFSSYYKKVSLESHTTAWHSLLLLLFVTSIPKKFAARVQERKIVNTMRWCFLHRSWCKCKVIVCELPASRSHEIQIIIWGFNSDDAWH